nr:MAG TPA: tail protein [Caudoviricetes sp.]
MRSIIMTKQEMIKTLPTLYRKDKWVNQIYNMAQLQEVDNLSYINYNNLFMTKLDDYGCSLYERDLLIDAKETLEDRRNAIITKWRATHRCTLELLQDIVNQWFGDKCEVTYDGNATVTHTTKVGTRYDPNNYYYQTFLKYYMGVFPAHFNLIWNHTHNRWIDYCKPYNWGYAKEKYLNWRVPKSHKWKDEKTVLRGKRWNYNLTRTWNDVYDSEINWED